MTDDHYYMGEALAQARLSLGAGEVPVGAVLVLHGGKIVAHAHNFPISLKDPTAHAEILLAPGC